MSKKPREWWIVDESTDPADKADRWLYGRFHEEFYNHIPEEFQIKVVEKFAYDALNAENEVLRIQLAGCGVAALSNTEDTVKQRIDRSNPYWSASYGDVCDAVDREIELRTANRELLAALKKIAIEDENNNNFSRAEQEAAYYIEIAREALKKWGW